MRSDIATKEVIVTTAASFTASFTLELKVAPIRHVSALISFKCALGTFYCALFTNSWLEPRTPTREETHPDPIWNLEATIDIEHQIKSVLYYWWSQVKKSSEARFLTWWFQRQQIFKTSWWFQRTVNLLKIHQFLGIFTNVMDFKIRSLNLCLKG